MFRESPSPDYDTILEADGHDGELKNVLWVHVVMCPFRSLTGKRFTTTHSFSCGDKNEVTPNDRRRVAKPREFDFPLYVFRLAPFKGRVSVWCHSCPKRPPPLAPLLHRIQRLAKRPPREQRSDCCKEKRKRPRCYVSIEEHRDVPRMHSVGCIFNPLGQATSRASIDTANPYSFRT